MNDTLLNEKTHNSIRTQLEAMGVTCTQEQARVRVVGLAWPYYLRPLGPDDIAAIQALQSRAGDGQVLVRSTETLAAHFNAGHTGFGVFHEGRLVAQSLISENLTQAATLPTKEALTSCFMTQSLMGGVVVAPEARGHGLMDVMVRLWLDDARQKGIHLAHARVRPGNEKSWQVFMRNGLVITDVGPSPDNPDHDVFFLHKPLQAAFALQDDFKAANRCGDIKSWLKRGYIATAWQPQLRNFTLAKPAKASTPG